MATHEWDDLVQAALSAAKETGLAIGEVPLEEIARHAGLSRATLYRRIGSRRALLDAIGASGIDAASRSDVRDRATSAAANLIESGGLAELTLENVANLADCSIRALHSQLGGRNGLLAAVFERYSPLPRIERVLDDQPATLETGVRAIYRTILDTFFTRPGLLTALLADVAARPDGPTAQNVRNTYLPRVMSVLVPWLTQFIQSGEIRPMPTPTLLTFLVGPVGAHVLLGSTLAAFPSVEEQLRDDLCEIFTVGFLRAIARAPDAFEKRTT